MDCSSLGSSVHGNLHVKILESSAIPFSRVSFRPRIKPGSPAWRMDSLPSTVLAWGMKDVWLFFFSHSKKHPPIQVLSRSDASGIRWDRVRTGWWEVWGRTDTSVCIAESLCCLPKTITMLLMSYTPIQKKKLFSKKEAFCWGLQEAQHEKHEW